MSEELNSKSEVRLEKELNLLDEFAPPTFDEWKLKVETDLKGAPFEKLFTKTYENITLQPIYTQSDIKNLPHLSNISGSNDYVRGTSAAGYLVKPWNISQEISCGLAEDLNAALKNDLQRGLNTINIKLDTATKFGLDADYAEKKDVGNGVSISGINSLERAFDGIDISNYPIEIDAGFSAFPFLAIFKAYLKKNNIDLKKIKGAITADPIGYLSVYGELPISLEFAFAKMKAVIENINSTKIRTVSASGLPYHNSGASAVQELAFALATATEYLAQLTERGIDINIAAKSIKFSFGISTFYFMEIAKFRAARLLWAKIVKAFGGDSEAQKMFIHAKTSEYFQTKLDPYVNMLRTTTEAFSAVVGGVDSLTTSPFNEVFGTTDDFSRRIARNVQIILKEESHLDSLIDPAGGSYYVEKLTHDVAEEVLKLIKNIEEKGGIIEALKTGFVQAEIKKVVDARNKNISKRKDVIVGNNMYANVKEDRIPEKTDNSEIIKKRTEYLQKYRVAGSQENNKSILEKLNKLMENVSSDSLETAVDAILQGATLGEVTKSIRASVKQSITIEKLNIHRAAEIFESLRNEADRIENEKGTRPKIFLANMGPLRKHKARADFSRGFFEVAGFDVIYPDGFDTPEAAAAAALKSGTKIICICSTDDNYPEIVAPITSKIKEVNPDLVVILAGYPKEQIEDHKNAGVDEFIFMGADVYSICKKLLESYK